MALLAYFPIAVFGGVFLAVCIACSCVQLAERARSRRIANAPRRRRFEPRMIQGGKTDVTPAETSVSITAEMQDKLAG